MKNPAFHVWLILSTAVMASCSFPGPSSGLGKLVNPDGYNNPHTDCAHCHESIPAKDTTAPFPKDVDPSGYCLDCHDYSVNHHPVNIVPAIPTTASFPLFNGKVTCLTCHEIHGGPQHAGTPKLLRGGPYADRRAICFGCHTQERYAKIDPHIMQDRFGNRTMIDGKVVCLFCHVAQPDPSQDTANTVLFRADINFLCWRCHPQMHGGFLDKHFLVTPSEEFLKSMNRPAVQENFTLPLVPRGRITCSTCHNPHQQGIISYGPAAAGADSLHRLRSNNICAACHNT